METKKDALKGQYMEGGLMYRLLVVSTAFSPFIVCPRMTGMTNVVANATKTNLVHVAVLRTILSIPLIIAMVLIFK